MATVLRTNWPFLPVLKTQNKPDPQGSLPRSQGFVLAGLCRGVVITGSPSTASLSAFSVPYPQGLTEPQQAGALYH